MHEKIGLKRGTVILKKHHKEWAETFGVEKKLLRDLLGDTAIEIQHIGSTAVPGLAAKPIIDIVLAVTSFADIPNLRPLLEDSGYAYRENGSDKTQVLFAKGPEEFRTHYLHITTLGSSVWRNDIAFRDYLRTHPKAMREYEKLKKNLASRYADNREGYTASKDTFIKSVLETTSL